MKEPIIQPPEDKPSKSQLKRDMTGLQKLGETLTNLSDSELADIPLSDSLLEAIVFTRTLKTHESKRRHLQYIGKIMRKVDTAAILSALKKMQLVHEKSTSEFHHLEQWRDQLIAEGDDALQNLMKTHPELDRQKLRQLIRKAQHDASTEKNTGGASELFRYLRENVVTKS